LASAAAAARFAELPVPTTTDEAWRFTDLAGFDPASFAVVTEPTVVAESPRIIDLDVAGLAVVSETGLTIERAPEGIRFELLTEDDPRLYSLVGWEEKFAAHNAGSWRQGLLVHVGRGVVLEKPLYVRIASAIPGSALFWRLLVVAEERSRFALIEEYTSATPDLVAYSNAAAELFVGQAAKLEYVSIQNLAQTTWHFATHHARVERDGELDWVAGGFGSKNGKIRIQNDLSGPGATSRVTGAYFADGEQHLDYDTFQEHMAPSTQSDFAFKGALRGSARAVWRGMIRVEEEAQKTNAYQENRNLLLSDSAHADSIPGLEIMANDVRCTHGATIGRIDRNELFYLMTRGLSRGEAERLIVRGFFQDVLDRIDLEPVRDALAAALEARIPQG
jgi:Fe-S cluster assembly protein SufD